MGRDPAASTPSMTGKDHSKMYTGVLLSCNTCAVRGPRLSQSLPPLHQLAAPVGCIYCVGDGVGKCLFDDMLWKVGLCITPILKRRPEAVHRQLGITDALQQFEHGFVANRLSGLLPGEHIVINPRHRLDDGYRGRA